jgi:glycerate-2-kinase
MPTSLLDTARRMAATAVAAVDPERLVREELARRTGRFDAVLALGKASAAMARGTREALAAMSAQGFSPKRLLIRPHSSPGLLDPGWEQKTGGHPLPDRQSVVAGERLRAWLEGIGEEQTLLALLSGGASACLELPAPGLGLEDLTEVQRALLGSGLPIGAVNAVRKHLSALKGGGALRATRGRVVVLLLSDVPGDDPATIASGLFAADPSTYSGALATIIALTTVLGLRVPPAVRAHLESGARGEIAETLKPGSPALARVESVLLGSVHTAMALVAAEARRQGFAVSEGSLTGEAARAARDLVARGRSLEGASVALVLGGETTVTVGTSGGRGGRNGELALAAARELAGGLPGQEEVVLALATDGEDGTTGTAGAAVDARAWEAVRRAGIEPEAALARHDSLTALEKVPGAPLRTGVTGTNVGDLALYLRRTLTPVPSPASPSPAPGEGRPRTPF